MAVHSLFIGIDRHASPDIQDLSFAARDAKALAALFGDTFGSDARLLTDGAATREAILDALVGFATCEADDTVVIGFSGHGSEDHCLVTHDAGLGNLSASAIPLGDLENLFARIPARRLILVLDCCFAGAIGAKVLTVEARTRDPRSAEARLGALAGDGRLILTASAADEPATEYGRHAHGFLTHFLIEGLLGAEEAMDGERLSLLRLVKHVSSRVSAAAAAIGRVQTPAIRGSLEGDIHWPVFVKERRWREGFPEQADVRVDERLESLAAAGFPPALIEAWGKAIPSLNPLQQAAINDYGLLAGDHLLVSAPTSSGKTMIGELAALKAVTERRRAIFLLPLKALVADKKRHFEAIYGEFGVRVFEATGETDDIGPLIRGKYDIALLTYEKFAAIALRFPHVAAQAGVVVVDEVQMVADEGRGANLEFLLTLLRMRRREDVEPQLIALSAVIGDTCGFEEWLGGRLLRRTERPVPLDEGLLLADGRFRHIASEAGAEQTSGPIMERIYQKGSGQDWIIPLVRMLVAEGEQVILFREKKGEARGSANYLAQALGLPPASDALARLPANDPSLASGVLRECLARGVAFHHSDLTADERQVVEEEFRRPGSGLRVISATTTLAMGVNTPANSVIIAGLTHPGPGDGTPYSVAEYKNLVGRAGRLGYSERGRSFLLALSPNEEYQLWGNYVRAAPENLRSRFLARGTDPRSLIIRVIASASRAGAGVTHDEILDFLEASFGAFLEQRAVEGWRWDEAAFEQAMADLEQHGLIETTEDDAMALTPLGRVAGESGTEIASILRFIDALKGMDEADVTDPALIIIVQASAELDQLHFPLNRKSTQKEPEAWRTALVQQPGGRESMRILRFGNREEHGSVLRMKKAVAALLFVSGKPMAEIEDRLTQFGGRFDGASGPVRGVAARTCDILPTAARLAELLHPGLDLGERVERLALRLTHGVPAAIVDLVREAGGTLTRGDYCALADAGLAEPEALLAASDAELERLLGDNPERWERTRAAATRANSRRAAERARHEPVLEPYIG